MADRSLKGTGLGAKSFEDWRDRFGGVRVPIASWRAADLGDRASLADAAASARGQSVVHAGGFVNLDRSFEVARTYPLAGWEDAIHDMNAGTLARGVLTF